MSKEKREEKPEVLFDYAIKWVGLLLLIFMIVSHVFFKEISFALFGIPIVMVGLDGKLLSILIKK